MSKYFKYIAVLMIFCAGFATSCSGPKTIPEKKLAAIFSDMFLVNAYADKYPVTPDRILDSVDIYSPIFEKYGYTSRDFMYTLNEFAKLKSTRVRDILDAAIERLDDEFRVMVKERQYLNFVDSVALVITGRVVYTDSLLKISRLADTAKMFIALPAEMGDYEIVYYYTLDSLDKNKNLQNTFSLYSEAGRRLNHRSLRMTPSSRRTKQSLRLEANESTDSLIIRFGNYPAPKDKGSKPYLQIDSLVISHTPRIDEAREVLYQTLPIKGTIIDSIRYGTYPPKDSIALRTVPPLAREEPDSITVARGDVAVAGDER